MYHVAQPDTNRFTKFKGTFGPLQAIAQIRLEYADGSVETVGTDEQWRANPGPITSPRFSAARILTRGSSPPGGTNRGLTVQNGHPPLWSTARAVNSRDCLAPRHHFADLKFTGPWPPTRSPTGRGVRPGPERPPRAANPGERSGGSRVRLMPAELTNSSGLVDQGSMGAGRRGRFWCTYTKGTTAPKPGRQSSGPSAAATCRCI